MKSPDLTTIGFDADDTLWHNERYFRLTQDRFLELLADVADPEQLEDRLLAAERRNVVHYGFGIKGFTLSMIETAIEVTEGRVSGRTIWEILEAGRDMLSHPVEPLPGARQVLERLKSDFILVLITKGDLFDQERKLAESGLGEMFDAVEIVSDKTEAVYERIFTRHGAGPKRAMMVGNSLRSDILPALGVGAWAVHVPYHLTWGLEEADTPLEAPRFLHMDSLASLPEAIAKL